jgi:hypothetical protein
MDVAAVVRVQQSLPGHMAAAGVVKKFIDTLSSEFLFEIESFLTIPGAFPERPCTVDSLDAPGTLRGCSGDHHVTCVCRCLSHDRSTGIPGLWGLLGTGEHACCMHADYGDRFCGMQGCCG